jgi:flagellar protein FliL
MSAPETTDAPAAPAPAGKAKKTILLAVVIVLGIGLGGAGGVMMAGPLLAGGAPGAASAEAEHAGEDEEEAKADTTAPAIVYMVENLVLNPAGTNGSRFLLLTVGLAVPDEAASQALQARDPELRDVVIRQLGAQTVEALADITRRDTLKTQLKSALVERFGKRSVLDVYFPQFVIQ